MNPAMNKASAQRAITRDQAHTPPAPQDQLRVLMLTSSYPRFDGDPSSVFLRELARHISACGARVRVLAPEATHKHQEPQDSGVETARFRYWCQSRQRLAYGSGIMPNLRAQPWLYAQVPPFIATMSAALRSQLRQWRPQIIHAHWVLPQGMVASWLGARSGVPVVISCHGADAFAMRSGLFTHAKRHALRQATTWTVNSAATADAIGSSHALPAPVVIPMGVDVRHFAAGNPGSLKNLRADAGFIILFVGRLVAKKGVASLIEAFAYLPAVIRENSRLWIVGEGCDRKSLELHAADLRISARVDFIGSVEQKLLPDYLAAADVFVMPSIHDTSGDTEGQGVAIIEAMAAGLPLVASRVGGIPEIFADMDETPLPPPADPKALAHQLNALYSDPEKRKKLGVANALRAHDYDWPKIADQFMNLYRTISERGP